MATAEIHAYLAGAEVRRQGLGLTRILTGSRLFVSTVFPREAVDAVDKLGHDVWAYWVRRGYEEGARV